MLTKPKTFIDIFRRKADFNNRPYPSTEIPDVSPENVLSACISAEVSFVSGCGRRAARENVELG